MPCGEFGIRTYIVGFVGRKSNRLIWKMELDGLELGQ